MYFPLFELERTFLEKTPKRTGKFALLILINIVVFILKYTYIFNRISFIKSLILINFKSFDAKQHAIQSKAREKEANS